MTIQTFVGYSGEFGVISRHYPLVDNFLNSHYLSACQCIKIVRRIHMLVTNSPWADIKSQCWQQMNRTVLTSHKRTPLYSDITKGRTKRLVLLTLCYVCLSYMIGMMTSSYDIPAMIVTPLISYIGGSRKKPAFCAWGVFTMGVGFFIFMLPHFVSPPYEAGRCIRLTSLQQINENWTSLVSCLLLSLSTSSSFFALFLCIILWSGFFRRLMLPAI